jgi:probable F420-dependent oxidoreductase
VVSFGVTVHDRPVATLLELVAAAEEHGFDYAWAGDSQVIWPEGVTVLALMCQATTTLKLGHCVTNPVTRDLTVLAGVYATLQEASGGRMVMGIGRGDTALRLIGREPTGVKAFGEACEALRALMDGEVVQVNGQAVALKYVTPMPAIPIYMAAYGPRMLELAGRSADGVIIQAADPEIVSWIVGMVRDAAKRAGRDSATLEFVVCAPTVVSDDRELARDRVRWFPALAGKWLAGILDRYADELDLPPAMRQYGADFKQLYRAGDYGRSDAAYTSRISDDMCDRLALIGSAAELVDKIGVLESVGATQCNIYLMTPSDEAAGIARQTVEEYGTQIIERVRQVEPAEVGPET